MERREFLLGAMTVAAAPLMASVHGADDKAAGRRYHLLGVPLRAGSLMPGNENDAQAYRDAQIVERMRAAGLQVVDDGDVAIPSYLPHHSVPPIRSWPAPRIAWEAIRDRVAPILGQPGEVPFLIGCDCSVVVGTTEALAKASPEVHVLYIDGDFDDAAPVAARSTSAASCAVWLLTHESPFWAGPILKPSQVTVIGWTNGSRSPESAVSSISLAEVRRRGAREAAIAALRSIPASASILLHFDMDVLRKADLPVAYFPHAEGMSLSEAGEMLKVFLSDSRIRIVEVSEYAALRDLDGVYVRKLIDLFCGASKR